MPIDFQPFLDQVRTEILTVWPEVEEHGVWYAEHVARVDWLNLTVPFAVILVPDWPRRSDWGIANLTFGPTVTVFYVGETDGDAEPLYQKLLLLANALWPTDPFKAAGVAKLDEGGLGDLSVGDDLAPNRIFSDAERSQRAGQVQFTALIGVTR